nr:hypothetical protein [Streptomyces sp. F12]
MTAARLLAVLLGSPAPAPAPVMARLLILDQEAFGGRVRRARHADGEGAAVRCATHLGQRGEVSA